MVLLGVDVGGTFTDAALLAEGRVFLAKAPTTPDDQSVGVLAAVDAVLARAGRAAGEVDGFAHGMTVATNALLEGRGARTALIATAGFEDVVELGRQARAHLYRLCEAHPPPLVPPERRFPAPERMGPRGPLRPLDGAAAAGMIATLAASGPEAVAVVLLHSHVDASHELELAGLLERALPGVHVSLSHQVVGTFREYERAATTEADAALSPLLSSYLRALTRSAGERGLPAPAVMRSSGGLADAPQAAEHAVHTVLSGPAGGVRGALLLARRCEVANVLCFDMGGTSCDVCAIEDHTVAETAHGRVGGRALAVPMLDIHTVGAGGGSVAWRDAGGALRVGPRSAGARPGPACYGAGGTEPTVTDANLLLGYLPADRPLAGGIELDAEAARRAVGALADELDLDVDSCAEGIVRVANAEMVRALRVVTVERGLDPRRYALMPFGGAGPVHATAIASELGISRIICPRASGVLSALGLAAAPSRRDTARSVLRSGPALTRAGIAEDVAALTAEATAQLGEAPRDVIVRYEMRYRGQSFELSVAPLGEPEPELLRSAFEDAHEERYGYRDPAAEIELVTVRVSAQGPAPAVELEVGPGEPPTWRGARARFDGETVAVDVLLGAPPPGATLSGPAIVALEEATLVVGPGWSAVADRDGTIMLRA